MAPRTALPFVAILVLVNFVLVSSAPRTYEASKTNTGILALGEHDIASPEVKAQHSPKDSDTPILRVGTPCSKDTAWESVVELRNALDKQVEFPIDIKVEGSKHIHYLSIISTPGSPPTVIRSPKSSNTPTNQFIALLPPKSKSIVSVLVGGH